jgi:hypothetical protein
MPLTASGHWYLKTPKKHRFLLPGFPTYLRNSLLADRRKTITLEEELKNRTGLSILRENTLRRPSECPDEYTTPDAFCTGTAYDGANSGRKCSKAWHFQTIERWVYIYRCRSNK